MPAPRLILLAFILLGQLLLPVGTATAAGIDVRPFLVDVEMVPRESKTQTITLQNNYPTRKAVLYATVNEISLDAGGEIKQFVSPVMTDRTNTVTSWIEINRGRLEVKPGELLEVPLTIKVHPYAEPGEYHAFIGLVEASKRHVAEAIAKAGDANGVIVKITIADERKDSMRISRFLIDRFVIGEESKHISVEVENMGDVPSTPAGEIIFYDSRGVEVDNVELLSTEQINPGETAVIDATVPIGSTLGRFKANVSLAYGENQSASLYDTTYFYMMPWNILLMVIGAIVVVSLLLTLLLLRALSARDEYEDGEEVALYVKDGHDPKPKDHDIDLKKNSL
jgi:hypothetical protein